MSDLAVDLAENLAVDLAENLAPGGTWRDTEVPDIAEYWRYGFGEGTVSDNLQTWTGQLAESLLAAPSSGQRFTPGSNAWTLTSGNSTILQGAAAIAALLQGTNAYTVYWIGSATANGETVAAANSASESQYHSVARRLAGGTVRYTRRNTSSDNKDGVVAWSGTNVTATVFDGTNVELYFDKVSVIGPSAVTVSPTTLNTFAIGGTPDLSPSLFMSGTVSEVIVASAAHDSSTVEAITDLLNGDYP